MVVLDEFIKVFMFPSREFSIIFVFFRNIRSPHPLIPIPYRFIAVLEAAEVIVFHSPLTFALELTHYSKSSRTALKPINPSDSPHWCCGLVEFRHVFVRMIPFRCLAIPALEDGVMRTCPSTEGGFTKIRAAASIFSSHSLWRARTRRMA